MKHIVNMYGWKTDRKIVVIESDDWGSIRMPSKRAHDNLLLKGIPVDRSVYDRLDTLETGADLNDLFEILLKYVDSNGDYPIMTFNTVMGNPDFEKIKRDHFKIYHFENFLDSYKKYHGEDLKEIWFRAMDKGLIRPQFHAREHLNVSLWMKALQQNNETTMAAFEEGFFGLKTRTPSKNQKNYLAAYWAEGENDFNEKVRILEDGLGIFENIFGFNSESFIACNFVLPKELEENLYNFGVKYIQGQRGHLSPGIKSGKNKIRRQYTGKSNNYHQYYLLRNCNFEPSLDENKDWVDECLKEIQTSFKWKKPAIISSHRINYVGGLSLKNRENGLKNLDLLLNEMTTKWPEIEFMTSDKLGSLIDKAL